MLKRNAGPKTSGIIWLVGIVILLVILFLLFSRNENKIDERGAASDSTLMESEINNNWTGIDPNVPVTKYEELKDTSLEVRANDQYAVYSIKEAALFEPGKSSIGKSGTEKLAQIAASAEKRFAGGQIIIYGYKDPTGTNASNELLAFERAEAVKSWLINSGNIEPGRISAKTNSESNPDSGNYTEESRAENRRLDIVIRKKQNE